MSKNNQSVFILSGNIFLITRVRLRDGSFEGAWTLFKDGVEASTVAISSGIHFGTDDSILFGGKTDEKKGYLI